MNTSSFVSSSDSKYIIHSNGLIAIIIKLVSVAEFATSELNNNVTDIDATSGKTQKMPNFQSATNVYNGALLY
jgi:hypothetical protein